MLASAAIGMLLGPHFTAKQAQHLPFIYMYAKVNRSPPAEADIQAYFGVTPPAVPRMALRLERLCMITREPGRARSIRLVLPPADLPVLQ